MNLISVVMPYYNKKNYIVESINSVLDQTYQNFEIIIVYDDKNKTDIDFIKKISELDKRIRVIYNKKNIGAGLSRNVAIKNSRGKYLAFLDCDDLWHRNKLKKQLHFMKKKNADFSHTSYQLIDSKGKKLNARIAKLSLNYKNLIKSCDIGLSTVMIKKKLLNSYYKFPNLKTKEDYVLWLKLAKKKIIFYGLNIILAQWRIINNSLSANPIQKIFDAFLVYNKYMRFSFLKSCRSVFLLSLNYMIKKYL
jgi:teichuronic acid biosynthesis glycosyltransferase TuaG